MMAYFRRASSAIVELPGDQHGVRSVLIVVIHQMAADSVYLDYPEGLKTVQNININLRNEGEKLVVGGNVVPAQTITPMSAAQLAQATFVAGATGTADDIYVEAFDGQAYSGWNAGSLFSGSDVDGDTLSYYVYDANIAANSGHFVIGGNAVPAQTITAMSAAQLAQATFVAGAAGTADDIYVEAFDGQVYSGWNAGVHIFV